ncbi:MAG: RsiV family protein, partial [Myxococcota bacterium]
AYFKRQIDGYKGLKEDVLQDGDLKVVKPNDNFFVTKGGVGFHFNIYEIACYAIGSFDAFIPFVELKGLLKENSPISQLFTPAVPSKP